MVFFNYMISATCGLIYFDTFSGLLKQGDIATSPRNVIVRQGQDGQNNLVLNDTQNETGLSILVALIEAGSDTGKTLWTIRTDRLTSNSEADVDVQGKLLPIAASDLDALVALIQSAWLVTRNREVLRKGCARPQGDFRLQLAHLTLHLDSWDFPVIVQEETQAAGQRVLRSVHLLSEGWKVERLDLFAPLVYMTIFGSTTFFETMALAVTSLERLGGYEGDYLIISDRDAQECQAFMPEVSPERVRHVRSNATSLRDITAARMNVERDVMADCQPILYMDSDIICDAPVQEFLTAATLHNRILLATEFPGQNLQQVPDHITNWFGRFLSHEDHALDSRLAFCANSGLFCARNADILLGPLRTALAVWRYYGQKHDLDSVGMNFDQPFINYALQKTDSAQFELLNHVSACIYGHTPSTEGMPRGFVHFNSGVGVDKQERMLAYLSHLLGKRTELLAAD